MNYTYTKKKVLLLLLLPVLGFAQQEKDQDKAQELQLFNNSSRMFKDWSVTVGGGPAFMAKGDVTSFYDGKINWGWNGFISVDKQITHTIGMSLMYTRGQTNQKALLDEASGVAHGYTKFNNISLLGDINFSNLMRRVDNRNKSNFKLALHGYIGFGVTSYKTFLQDDYILSRYPLYIEQKLGINSFSYIGGLGLKYNLSKLLDLELRTMYLISGDDEFDGGGWTRDAVPGYNLINDSYSDNAWFVNLGVSFKLGRRDDHLRWVDPLQDAYTKIGEIEKIVGDFNVCENGDLDDDGVCDDWDRQLDTPKGARVDGAGVALDMDLDGVIDLNDKCVTVAGPKENDGCPIQKKEEAKPDPAIANLAQKQAIIDEINKYFSGVEFELGKSVIRTKSYAGLDKAADIIKELGTGIQFTVVGATDTRGVAALNKKLSQSRAEAVVEYLVGKGISKDVLSAEGRGKEDLKYPECDPASKCPEWKNEANRRVFFETK